MNNIEIGSIVTATGRLIRIEECKSAPVTVFEVAVEQSNPDDVKIVKPRPEIGTYMKHRTGRTGKLIDFDQNVPTVANIGTCLWINLFDLSETELKALEAETKKAREDEWRKQLEKIPVDLLMEAIKQRVK